jgi:TonB-dependent Receptor Plug Domain/CarboxypepD_reg-like domain
MLKTLLLLPGLLLHSVLVYCQPLVTGRVLDGKTHEPVESALVSYNEAANVLTDAQGRFTIKSKGIHGRLTISMIGYQARSVEIYSDAFHTIYMERGPVDLKEIIISPQANSASFHNISAIDLNMRPVNSSQDLMRRVPGLFLGQHQGGGLAEHIFFRGFDADHGTDVNVSVDGMPLNLVSHAHGQGFADLHFLIPELVSKYEFGKGPYYAPYGDFTTAGYVNFTTYDVLDKNMVKVEGGQFNTGRVMAMTNLLSARAVRHGESAWVAAEAAYTDGPFNFAQHLNRVNVFGKYLFDINKSNRLNITISTFSSGWRSSGEIPERAVTEGIINPFGYIDSAQGGTTSRSNVILKLHSDLSQKLVMENMLYYSHYFFNLNYDATLFADDSINGDQLRQREGRDLAGYNSKLTFKNWYPGGGTLTSTIGAGCELNRVHNSELSHTVNKTTVLQYLQYGSINEGSLNAYVDENLLLGKWLLNFGGRIDALHFNYLDKLQVVQPPRSKAIISPKLNVEYTASPKWQAYLKVGKGFHSNDARVVIANHGRQILPAAYGADLGINYKPFKHLFINAAVWYLKLSEEFVYDADEGTLEPGGRTRRQGADLSMRYQLTKWLFASADVNICKARSADAPKGNNYLPLAVPLSATGGLDFKLANGFNGGLSYRYLQDRPANENNSLTAQGYFIADCSVNYTKAKYEVGLEIQNLFNTKWREAQFAVESRLRNETAPVEDISFTPGVPFFAKLKMAVFF